MPTSSKDRKILEAQAVIADRIKDLPTNFLDCRDPGIRHAWMKETDFHVTKTTQIGRRISELARIEVCARCNTQKIERFIMGRYGIEKVGQHYEYPEGYLLSGSGAPRGVKRSTVVWGENYRRAMEKVAEGARGDSLPDVDIIEETPTKAPRAKATARGRRR